MKRLFAIPIIVLILLSLAACGIPSAPSEPAESTPAPAEKQTADHPHALADDCFFVFRDPGNDPRLLFNALVSDEAYGEYVRKYNDNWKGVDTREDAKALIAFFDSMPFPISDEYRFSELRFLRESGKAECDIYYFMHDRDYNGLSGAYVEFSFHPDSEEGSVDALDKTLGQGGYTEIDVGGHTHIKRLYRSDAEFSVFHSFIAEIDGQFVSITTCECGESEILSFDFGTLTEAVEKELIKVY